MVDTSPGFTGDTLVRLFKLTALNPLFTLPLFLAGKYTIDGGRAAADHATAWKHLKTLLVLGVLDKVSTWLDNAVTNNWASDTYVWSQEVVVVTGGSDGIGKIVVHLLAEKGIKVAVLDVQEPTYEGKRLLLNTSRTPSANTAQHRPPFATSTATSARPPPSKTPPRPSAARSATPPSSSTTPASPAARPSSTPPRKTST
jgi:hypothetical protein